MRLFGDVEKAIGQQIKSTTFYLGQPYIVTAVVKDQPPTTNLPFDAILYHDQIKQQKSFVETSKEQIWSFATLQGYVRFHPHTNIDVFTKQLRDFSTHINAERYSIF